MNLSSRPKRSGVEGPAVPRELQQNPFHAPRVGEAGGRLIRNKTTAALSTVQKVWIVAFPYSHRNAVMGSTEDALHDGTRQASPAAARSTKEAPRMSNGSSALLWAPFSTQR